MEDSLAALQLSRSVADEVLAPFIVKRFKSDDKEVIEEKKRLERRWKHRRWKRRLFGWLPHGMNVPRLLRGARTQQYVMESYNENWGKVDWPNSDTALKSKELAFTEWQDEYLLMKVWGLSRIHLTLMADVLSSLNAKSVLEVGSGNGLNLFVLASRFPDVTFQGIELTENGVAQAKAAQECYPLPQTLVDFFPWPMKDEQALRQITFRQGDATSLPFEDSSFDVVFTRLALEQMETIRDSALNEISRVARHHVMMIEPFAEFNHDSIRRNYIQSKDYFSLPYSKLESFGILPIGINSDFPQKLTLGAGMVVGKVLPKS